MTKLTRADLNAFLHQTPVAVIHLDAEWDGYRFAVAKQIALTQVSQISAKSSDFRPSAALEALILRGVALADPLWADLGC